MLEIGCGGGVGVELIFDQLGANAITAIDLDPDMLRRAAQRLEGRASLVLADMAAVPAPSGCFDAVVDFGALHLADDWRQALAEVGRVLVRGGRFFFEQPINPLYRWAVPRPGGGRIPGGFGRSELLDAIESAGFVILELAGLGAGRLDLAGVARRN